MMKRWYPVRIKKTADFEYCEWTYFDNPKFTDPFFEESWGKAKSHPYNSSGFISSSDLSLIKEWNMTDEASKPTAIIFHCSRCGSTLLSQLLGIHPNHVSLSEVPLFDQLLMKTLNTSETEQLDYLKVFKSAVNWYAQHTEITSSKLFIKTDSWHFFFWEQYRASFKGVPFVLLYRNPLEIFESQDKLKGMHAVPGIIEPQIFNLSTEESNILTQQEYLGKVLEFYFTTILKIKEREPKTLLLNYEDGGLSMISSLYEYLGLDLTEKEKLSFNNRMQFHSKNSNQIFKEDLQFERIPHYLEKCMLLYYEVERLRLS